MPFSDEDLLDPVKSIIDNKIANMVRKDGGDIELITVKNATVFVQLKGSCVGCSSSSTTLKYVVEKELKDAIHPEIKIIKVIIVSINSTIKIFKLKDRVSGFITIGPYNNVYKSIGKPRAKHISKILLPKAFEIASL